jgi:hypothetical protein
MIAEEIEKNLQSFAAAPRKGIGELTSWNKRSITSIGRTS